MNTLEKLRSSVGAHPLREEFKRLGIRQIEVALHIGMSPSSVAHILNGYRTAAPHIDSRLYALVAKIQRERAREAGGDE
jgi:transcriptional regulator with XRE-family HTH domain